MGHVQSAGSIGPIPIPVVPPTATIRHDIATLERQIGVTAQRSGTTSEAYAAQVDRLRVLQTELQWAGIRDAATGAHDQQRKPGAAPSAGHATHGGGGGGGTVHVM
jgi:hypothetical protein